jgi:hypothetical protein
MLRKLQIKLLSNSGELLNLVTCHAGQVSVFRGASPSEIRPYQRALTGSAGRERFSISLDGGDFVSDQHTLVGFGEPSPHNGMNVRQFLHNSGFLEGSIEGILIAYGLAHVGDALCANLTQDEERRVRLIAATNSPDKILIANEPFEPIATTWRERFAELLVSFARSRKGLVVVTSLSHRPECWIDNESIARIEVGQTAQRTIGFRAEGANNTKFIQELRQMLGDEEKVQQLLSQEAAPALDTATKSPARTAAAAGAVGAISTIPQSEGESTHVALTPSIRPFSSTLILKAIGGLGIGLVALGGLYVAGDRSQPTQTASVTSPTLDSTALNQTTSSEQVDLSTTQPLDANSKPSEPIDALANVSNDKQEEAVVSAPDVEQARQPKLLVDEYPEAIRASLVLTAQGILSAPQDGSEATIPAAAPATARKAPAGNLFTLLQGASSKEPEGSGSAAEGSGSYQPPPVPESDPEQFQDAEERREAIRQKFLEAIRSAAENRQHQLEE